MRLEDLFHEVLILLGKVEMAFCGLNCDHVSVCKYFSRLQDAKGDVSVDSDVCPCNDLLAFLVHLKTSDRHLTNREIKRIAELARS